MRRQLPMALLLTVTSLGFTGEAQQSTISRTKDAGQAEVVAQSWRHHPSYQVFAFRAAQLAIAPADAESIAVNDGARFPLHQQLSEEERQRMAHELGVPVGVIGEFLKGLGKSDHIVASDAAERLRTATIDYKYLDEQWNRYHPSGDQEKVKVGALEALKAGEIGKAWLLFDALPRPKPPGGLHVTDGTLHR